MDLFVNSFGTYLGKHSERIVIRQKGQEAIEVPIEAVSHVWVAAKGVSLSTDLIALAHAHEVTITLLSDTGEPYGRLESFAALGRPELRRAQLLATQEARGMDLSRQIIQTKLKNQRANLCYYAKGRKQAQPDNYDALMTAAERIKVKVDDVSALPLQDVEAYRATLMGHEGQAAKYYWSALRQILPTSLAFPGRVYPKAQDVVNACLNYGYGILYGLAWSAILRVGLDPYAGFLHGSKQGAPALVFDFVEEFRQLVVDRSLLGSLLKRWTPDFMEGEAGILTAHSRQEMAQKVLNTLDKAVPWEGKSIALRDVLLRKAYNLRDFIQQGAVYTPFTASW